MFHNHKAITVFILSVSSSLALGEECFQWREEATTSTTEIRRRYETVAFDSIRNQTVVVGGYLYTDPNEDVGLGREAMEPSCPWRHSWSKFRERSLRQRSGSDGCFWRPGLGQHGSRLLSWGHLGVGRRGLGLARQYRPVAPAWTLHGLRLQAESNHPVWRLRNIWITGCDLGVGRRIVDARERRGSTGTREFCMYVRQSPRGICDLRWCRGFKQLDLSW